MRETYLGVHNELVTGVHLSLLLLERLQDSRVKTSAVPQERNVLLVHNPLLLRRLLFLLVGLLFVIVHRLVLLFFRLGFFNRMLFRGRLYGVTVCELCVCLRQSRNSGERLREASVHD